MRHPHYPAVSVNSQYLETLTLNAGPGMYILSIWKTRNYKFLAHPAFSVSGKLQNRHASVASSSAPVPGMCIVCIWHIWNSQYLVYSNFWNRHAPVPAPDRHAHPLKSGPGMPININFFFIIIFICDIIITRQSQYLETLTLNAESGMYILSIRQTKNSKFLAHPAFSVSGKLQNRHASVLSSSAPVPGMCIECIWHIWNCQYPVYSNFWNRHAPDPFPDPACPSILIYFL